MRAVILTDPGVLELNWQWLPTWVGMNTALTQKIEREIAPLVQGKALTARELDDVSDKIINLIAEQCPLQGVRDYLDGLKFITEA